MDILTFDGVSFREFNTFWDGSELFGPAEKDVEFFSVPGQNGDLSIFNDRYKSKKRRVNCFIREDFKKNYSMLMNFLLSRDGYCRFENTLEPDIYRMAEFVSPSDPETGMFLRSGWFELEFIFKPENWLKAGEKPIAVSSSKQIENPTYFSAKPLIVVTGTGSITIGDSILALSQNTSTVVIDCLTEDASEGTINRNSDLTITNGFPVLKPGNNTVAVSGCSIEITPRWWRL